MYGLTTFAMQLNEPDAGNILQDSSVAINSRYPNNYNGD